MAKIIALLILSSSITNILSWGTGEEKFVKKYAMMKIYESCFGAEVVKQIRKELKTACLKCAAMDLSSSSKPQSQPTVQPSKADSISDNNDNSFYPNPAPNLDTEKLHQAILAFRPNSLQAPFYRPYATAAIPPLYNQPFVNPLFYQNFQQPNSYGPYGFPLVGQPFYSNRMSKDIDIKGQIESLISKMDGKVRNVTCVMQELGYLDTNLEPDYYKINERISSLPVSEELRRDMQDGVKFCQQFSQCMPNISKEKSPLSNELMRPMFFFKCYKHKKLEACIMKDVREKYAGVTDEEFVGNFEFRRNGKSAKLSTDNDVELEYTIYDFLHGSESNIDIDSAF